MSRTRHHVAVVVFADVEGADEHDAGTAATYAVLAALCGDRLHLPTEVPVPLRKADGATARVVDVIEAGMALRNGYLWAAPTSQAWRQRGLEEEEAS